MSIFGHKVSQTRHQSLIYVLSLQANNSQQNQALMFFLHCQFLSDANGINHIECTNNSKFSISLSSIPPPPSSPIHHALSLSSISIGNLYFASLALLSHLPHWWHLIQATIFDKAAGIPFPAFKVTESGEDHLLLNQEVEVVMDKFGSELWFKHEPPRTKPEVQFKVLKNGWTEPQVWFRVWQLRPQFKPVWTASV